MEQGESIEPVAVYVSPATSDYLQALEDLGLLTGDPGERSFTQDVLDTLIALHNALAGGHVSVQITESGTESVVQDLNNKLEAALRETNEMLGLDPAWVRF